MALSGRLFRADVGGLFYIYPAPDAGNPDRILLYTGQGGLGLPDESYYREEKFAPMVQAYKDHVATLFGLAGVADPEGAAGRVVALETALASHHWDKVTLRDPQKTYNLKSADEATELFPLLTTWFDAAGIAPEKRAELVVSTPDFFAGAASLLDSEPLSAWQEWLAMRVVSAAAPYLSSAFVDANFAFYGTTLSGTPRNKDRWKRGVAVVEAALGEAVGQIYVARHFPETHKARMESLVANLIEAYRESITGLDWMGEDTKHEALKKLDSFRAKIGYPDKWIDYSAVEIDPSDLLGNVERAHSADVDRHLDEVGKPVDRDKWLMTPQTVNAYYHPLLNEIVFPAAILQPPFFTADADDAVNYGGIGAVIGHEIGHGFDDQGSQYDGSGAAPQLVDGGRPHRLRGADRQAGGPVRRALPRRGARPQRQRQTDPGREHRRPRRPGDRVQGLPDQPRRPGAAGAGRPDRACSASLHPGLPAGGRSSGPRKRSAGSPRIRTPPTSSAPTRSPGTSTPSTRHSARRSRTACGCPRTSASASGRHRKPDCRQGPAAGTVQFPRPALVRLTALVRRRYRVIRAGLACWQTTSPAVWLTMSEGSCTAASAPGVPPTRSLPR